MIIFGKKLKLKSRLKSQLKKLTTPQVKNILILEDNGLGDYILARDFFKYIKQIKKYENHKIILLAKEDRIDFAKIYDANSIDEFILYKPSLMEQDKLYRKTFIKQLSNKNITDIINIGVAHPGIDKEPFATRYLLKHINAKNKIAHAIYTDNEKYKKEYNLYTKVIYTTEETIFEYERNRLFFEKLLGMQINLTNRTPIIQPTYVFNTNHIGIAPFARWEEKTLDLVDWSKLCNVILEKYPDINLMIFGCKKDIESANEIYSQIDKKERVINCTAKTSTAELPNIFASLKCLISTESGPVHLAHAVGLQTFVVSDGSYYKRFQPYPDKDIVYIYPDGFDKLIPNLNNKIIDKYYFTSGFDVKTIPLAKVINSFLYNFDASKPPSSNKSF